MSARAFSAAEKGWLTEHDTLHIGYLENYEGYDAMVDDMTKGVIDAAFPVGGGLYFTEENGLYQTVEVASAPTELVHKGEYTEETTAHFAVNENNRMQYYFTGVTFRMRKSRFIRRSMHALKRCLRRMHPARR